MTRPPRRYRPAGPVPLEPRTVPAAIVPLTGPPPPPSATVTNEPAPPAVAPSPWTYLESTDRTPLDRLPDPAAVTPLPYWAQLYGLGQIRLLQDRAAATLAATVADVARLEADPDPVPMRDASVLFLSALVGEQADEVRRLAGLRDWWLEIPVSDPPVGVLP